MNQGLNMATEKANVYDTERHIIVEIKYRKIL